MRQRKGLILELITVILWSSVLWAADEQGLVAHYTFDEGSGTILKDRSGNKNDGKIIGAGWVRGKEGAALDFYNSDYVDCGDYPDLRPTGPLTLAIWVRTISTEQQFIISYHGWNIYLAPEGTPTLETLLGGAWDSMGAKTKIPLNEWTFIAIVYNPDRQVQEIFVNGELSNSKQRTERPWKERQHFRSKVSLGGRQFNGLLDDFRIYMRALSPDEIKRLYQTASIDRTLEPSQYRFVMKPHLLFREQKIVVEISLVGPRKHLSEKEKPLSGVVAEVALYEKDKDRLIQQQTISNLEKSKKTEVDYSLAELKPGDYEIRTIAKSQGGELFAKESAWVTFPPKPWWFDSKEGVKDIVLPPYIPLKVKNIPGSNSKLIECWGRTYVFSTSLFPQQIITAEKPILAKPITLSAKVNGREVNWKDGTLQLQKETQTKAVFSFKASDVALELVANTLIEYDGMIRIDCEITPLLKCNLEQLILEIPLKQEYGTLQYQLRDELFKAPGIVPKEGLTRSFNHAIWLGDEERGVQWVTDSDQYWHLADKNRAIEILRDKDKVILRLNIITKPIELTPEQTPAFSYTFGLQATPLKPIAKDYWDYRWTSAHRYGADYAMLTDKIADEPVLDYFARLGVKTILLGNWTDAMSYPLPYGHYEKFRSLVKAIHQRGMQAIPYFGLQYSELAPEFNAFKDDFLIWESDTPYSYTGYPDNYPGGMPTQMVYGPCIRSDWQDFIVAGVARLIDEFDVDGIYFDNASLVSNGCMNPNHRGCGKLIRLDGSTTRAFSIFEGREMMRRIYQVIKSRKPDGQLDLHMASFVTTATLAWATGNWDGETILGEDRRGRNPVKGDFILNYLPLDSFRAQFMGENWGIPAEFLDYYVPYPYERQFALTMLHDVPIRAHVSPEKLRFQSTLWQVMDEFGRKQSEWLPYWKNFEYVAVKPDHAYVSLYRHSKNGVLAVVSNLGKEKSQVEVDLTLDKLGFPKESTAMDVFTKDSIPIKDGKVVVELDSVDWKLIWIKP